MCFFFSSRRRHTRYIGDWSSDVCSSDLATEFEVPGTVSLPSDGRKLTVSLAKLSLPAKMRLRVVPRLDAAAVVTARSEERRVGKECRSRGSRCHHKKNKDWNEAGRSMKE